jgi:hypothetical protein
MTLFRAVTDVLETNLLKYGTESDSFGIQIQIRPDAVLCVNICWSRSVKGLCLSKI